MLAVGTSSCPPLETSQRSIHRRRPLLEMNTPRFLDLHDVSEIARATGVPAAIITEYEQSKDQASFYTRLKIPKRGRKRAGQYRIVYRAKNEWLAQLHRQAAVLVMAGTPFGEHVQGFVHGRSIRTNATQHLGVREVLHGDIRDFFDSITAAQVQRGLISLGAPAAMADLWSRACTIDGYLRQGTRCSPALANLVCRQVDVDLLALAGVHGSTYTRYADDLTFSGKQTPSSEEVGAVLSQHGFSLRDGRCYSQRRGHAQFVTGLYVGDEKRPRLPSRLKHRLRLILHFVEKYGIDEHFSHHSKHSMANTPLALAGMLRYVQSIEPELARKWRAQFRAGSQKSRAARDLDPTHSDDGAP
jgi:hypothetical protein